MFKKLLKSQSLFIILTILILMISFVSVAYALDSDNDGLSDELEEIYGTDMYNPDTDGDGYTDGEEVENNYSPIGTGKMTSQQLIEYATKITELSYVLTVTDSDTDGDSLANIYEAVYGTNPENPDTDNDTYPDGLEVTNGFDPNGVGKLSQTDISTINKIIAFIGDVTIEGGEPGDFITGEVELGSCKSINIWAVITQEVSLDNCE